MEMAFETMKKFPLNLSHQFITVVTVANVIVRSFTIKFWIFLLIYKSTQCRLDTKIQKGYLQIFKNKTKISNRFLWNDEKKSVARHTSFYFLWFQNNGIKSTILF